MLRLISILQTFGSAILTVLTEEKYRTSSKLLKSRTRVHSSSDNIKSASFRHFSAFDSFMLSWHTNRSTCYREHISFVATINECRLTSRLNSALVNIINVEPQRTVISSNNCSGLTLFSSWIDLNNAFRCADVRALTHMARTRPVSSRSNVVRSGICASSSSGE